jgi:hypothetical protein
VAVRSADAATRARLACDPPMGEEGSSVEKSPAVDSSFREDLPEGISAS